MKSFPSLQALVERFPALGQIGQSRLKRSIPFVQQLTATECGAACLAMVLRFHGRNVGVDELRNIAVGGRDASNAQALIDAGRLYGLRGRAVSLEIDQLQFLGRGAVLHWAFTHFVVFDRLDRDAVHVVDPKRGRWRVPMDLFRKQFTGVAILFEPTEQFDRGGKRDTGWRRSLRQVLSERGFLPHIILTSVLLQLFGLGFPLLNRTIVDRIIPQHDYHLLGVLAAGILFLIVFQFWTSCIRALLFVYLRTRLDSRMTLGFFDHLLSLPFDFFQRRSTGDLMLRMGSNATAREILTGTILAAILDGALAIGYLVLLLALSWPMAALAAALAAIQLGLLLFTRSRQRQFLAESIDAQAKSQGYLMETLSAVEALKSLGAEERAVERWSGLFATELNVALKRGRLDAVLESLRGAVRTGSSMALLGVGTIQVLSGALSLGDMLAVTALASGFLNPLVSLASAGTRLQLLGVYMERITDVLDTPSERDRGAARDPGKLTGTINVDNVSFRYSPIGAIVVKNVSVSIRPGEFLAIVGRSGAGKSTLARLLVALFTPTEGTIAYDGVDMRQLDLARLRRQIGVVTQQAQLFGGTIRSNIALADPTLPLDAIMAAAKLACIHNDIMAMPMGYDTLLIDRGASLSGGQQQRLALARALVQNPRILVLDEATSQLDAATERAVQEQLATLECTRMVLAHRLSTIMKADRILVMDAGRVVEQGTHGDLIATDGAYARLVSAQLSATST